VQESEGLSAEEQESGVDSQSFSVGELSSGNVNLSVQQQRPFVERFYYETPQALEEALAAAKQTFPEVESAYKGSGKTNPGAILALLMATPLILALLLIVTVSLCLLFNQLMSLASGAAAESYRASRAFGLFSIIFDAGLAFLLVFSTPTLLVWTSKLLKNRNALFPGILAGLINFIVGIVLFIPFWDGFSLAPINLTFLFIPIQWPLMFIGIIIIPLFVALATSGGISSQKFCEDTGVYLKKMGSLSIKFDVAENALALLDRGAFSEVVHLPKAAETDLKRDLQGEIALWWHEKATIAFLEMKVFFSGEYKGKNSKESKDIRRDWLAFSKQLDRSEARRLNQLLPSKS